MSEIVVNIVFDDETKVYIATSDDVPGLVAEADTFESLKEKVLYLIPELVKMNNHLIDDAPTVPVELLIRQTQHLAIA